MDLLPFLRGIAIGFSVAAPIGPVGLLCIRKALADGRLAAFVAGMGAALADTLFGAAAAFGIGAVTGFIESQVPLIKTVGGVFMVVLGLRAWRAAAVTVEMGAEKGPGMWKDFLSTFLVTATNPGTILGVAGVFAALGTTARPGGVQSGQLVAGIFCGSALWWLALSAMAAAARTRITERTMRRFNHVSGGMLVAFGLAALASAVLG